MCTAVGMTLIVMRVILCMLFLLQKNTGNFNCLFCIVIESKRWVRNIKQKLNAKVECEVKCICQKLLCQMC